MKGRTKARSQSAHSPAPVAVFAFRRLPALSSTLASLERCDGFEGSSVQIFSDAARAGYSEEELQVAEVRAWLRDWCSRVGAQLHEASSNMGLHKAIVGGVSAILAESERVVVLEDDIVVSKTFLTFMNGALHAYADRPDIVQVSGNFVPRARLPQSIGLLRMPGCWGWATWRRAWAFYRDDAVSLLDEIRRSDTNSFDMGGWYPNLEALTRNATGQLDTWFVRWYASVFLKGGLTVYPGRSLTRNIGFDAQGVNCKPNRSDRVFSTQRIYDFEELPDWSTIGRGETPHFAIAAENFYRWQHQQWVKPSWRERARARVRLITGSTDL